jgi:hypothetical protein
MNIRRFFYCFFGCLGFFTGISQTVTWQSGDKQKNIGDALSILEDKNSNFTIDQITSD